MIKIQQLFSKHNFIFNFLAIFLWILVAFTIDRVTKDYILIYFAGHNNPLVITSFFNLFLIYNYGISFSFLNGLNSNLIMVISCCAIVILLWLFIKMFSLRYYHVKLAIGLIVGAALGNIYDRKVYGAVVDFFHLHYQQYSFPVFNPADVLITFSAIILLIDLIFKKKLKND